MIPTRRQLLTFVTAGGGFAGTETTGAINDFVRDTVRYYPDLNAKILFGSLSFNRVICLLPELGEELVATPSASCASEKWK